MEAMRGATRAPFKMSRPAAILLCAFGLLLLLSPGTDAARALLGAEKKEKVGTTPAPAPAVQAVQQNPASGAEMALQQYPASGAEVAPQQYPASGAEVAPQQEIEIIKPLVVRCVRDRPSACLRQLQS